MVSINILHASDLHISVHRQLRSPVDRLHDLENPWDISFDGLVEKALILPRFAEAWWKKMAASSYDPEALQALAEFIYKHARSKLDEAGQEIVDDCDDKLDAVVLTGDLATTGSYDDIKQASRFLWSTPGSKCAYKSEEKNYRGATLAAVKVPILCLPGYLCLHTSKALSALPELRDYLLPLRPQVARAVNHSKNLHLSYFNHIDNSIPSFDNFSNFLPLILGYHSTGIGKCRNLDRTCRQAIDDTNRIIR